MALIVRDRPVGRHYSPTWTWTTRSVTVRIWNCPFCSVRQGAVLMPGRPRGASRTPFRVITMGNE